MRNRFVRWLYVCCLLGLSVTLQAATPTGRLVIDFGTVTYASDRSGFTTTAITAGGINSTGPGTVTTSGSNGNMTNFQNDASQASVDFTNTSYPYIRLSITRKNPGNLTTSCGKLNITNLHMERRGLSSSKSYPVSSFPVGVAATLKLNSFTGTGACTMTADLSSYIEFCEKQSSGSTCATSEVSIPLTAVLHIVPASALRHDTGAALNFGTLCQADYAQTVTVSPQGNVTYEQTFCPASGSVSADSFTLSAANGTDFTVTLPDSVTLSNGTDNLTVSAFTYACSGGCTVQNGSQQFTVGGTLSIPDGVSTGNYEGNYSVSVTY